MRIQKDRTKNSSKFFKAKNAILCSKNERYYPLTSTIACVLLMEGWLSTMWQVAESRPILFSPTWSE
jgi:hypothetical protein